jgi:hypothetical protein
MSNVFRRMSVWGLVCGSLVASFAGPAARGQNVARDKFLSQFNLGVAGDGVFTSTATGIEKRDLTPLSDSASNTFGVVADLQYIKKPLLGFEFNYSYARFTQNYSANLIGGVQANAKEYTFGYVAHTKKIFGVEPYLGAGGGTIAFTPTPYGGEGLKEQARAVYYYDAGFEDRISPSFGIKAGFRQLIYLAPDFEANYLTITRRVRTSEPVIGFVLHF